MTRVFPRLRQAVALVAAVFAVSAGGEQAWAAPWSANEDDALLLELHSGQYKLGDTLRGYQTPSGVCVDFADLIQTLDLPVRLDKKSRRATGWLFAEDQRLVIDREANTVQTVNNNERLADSAIQDTPEGWCMNLSALSRWFGVRFKPDLGNLAIVLESDRKLPFLEAIERKSRAARLRAPSNTFDLAGLPQAPLPYQTWRTPSVDMQVQAQWSRATGAQVQYEALASGELLGMSYAARLTGTNLGVPEAFRLRIYRNDPQAELLGPLKASQFALGDVDTQRGGLTAQSAFGRGAYVTNRPLNQPSRFGYTALRGTLPAGWDAELYRNGELRAYQADRGDGRYDFGEVELQFGENEFDVVLYGPQGQIRHDRSSVPVGLDAIQPGKMLYWAGVVESGRDLIDLSRKFANPHTGWRWGVGVERGLDKRTTAGLEYQSFILNGRRRHYIEASLRRSIGPMLVELSGSQQLAGGRAFKAAAIGKLGGLRFDAEALWVDGDFESELVSSKQHREYSLRLSQGLNIGSWRLPIEAGIRHTEAKTGAKVTELLTRSSIRIARISLSAELSHRVLSGPMLPSSGDDSGTRLTLVGNTSLGKVRLRGSTRIGLGGTRPGVQEAQIIAETTLNALSSLRAGVQWDGLSHRREFMLGYVRQFKRFALRGEARADDHGRMSFGLTLGFSLGPDPVDGGWRVSRSRLAEEGQASVEVFRDENGDGYRQANEPGVEGVSIEAGFRHSDAPTNKQGRAVIDGLHPYAPVLVSIDTGSLPDPLLQPKGRGMVVVPRPGVSARLSLPLAPTGEIEAVLMGPDGEPRSGLLVELVDSAGQVVLQGRSDFDGYLLFDSVPYGDYHLRLGEEGARLLGLARDVGAGLRIDRSQNSHRLGRIRLQAALRKADIASASP